MIKKVKNMTIDVSGISSIAFQGVGMGILAGTAIRTMDIVERGVKGSCRTRIRTQRPIKLNIPKGKYTWKY